MFRLVPPTTMPSATSLLPFEAPIPYTKPTPTSTHNGKTYRPTHPDLFHVEMSSNINSVPGAEESFSSRLVAARVSHDLERC